MELEIKHDEILAEETQATRAGKTLPRDFILCMMVLTWLNIKTALEVLKKNHDVELQRQMSKFRAEYLEKMKGNIDLDEVIESQE